MRVHVKSGIHVDDQRRDIEAYFVAVRLVVGGQTDIKEITVDDSVAVVIGAERKARGVGAAEVR